MTCIIIEDFANLLKFVFLRPVAQCRINIGYPNYAIIDFHIIDILKKHKLIEKPKALTKKIYIKIESILKELAEKSSLTLAELDLYLCCLETGKILK